MEVAALVLSGIAIAISLFSAFRSEQLRRSEARATRNQVAHAAFMLGEEISTIDLLLVDVNEESVQAMGRERIPHAQGFADKLDLAISLDEILSSDQARRDGSRDNIAQHLLARHGARAEAVFVHAFELSFIGHQALVAIDSPERRGVVRTIYEKKLPQLRSGLADAGIEFDLPASDADMEIIALRLRELIWLHRRRWVKI